MYSPAHTYQFIALYSMDPAEFFDSNFAGQSRNRCNFLVSCIGVSTVIQLRSILVWSTSFSGSTACGSVVFLRSFVSSCNGHCGVCVKTSRMHRASRCPLTPGAGGFLRSEISICKKSIAL